MSQFIKNIQTYSGTIAGEEAAMYYADLVVKGSDTGGIKGASMIAAGWTGGFFASLWTPDTAVQTAFTLGTAGIGSWAQLGRLGAFGSHYLKMMQLFGSFQAGVSFAESVTGESIFGEKLTPGERLVRGAFGAFGLLTVAGFFGKTSPLFRRSKNGMPVGKLNTGKTRFGWSPNEKIGREVFSLHGGGTHKWHLDLNYFSKSSPNPAPFPAVLLVRTFQGAATIGSSYYGFSLGDHYLNKTIYTKPSDEHSKRIVP